MDDDPFVKEIVRRQRADIPYYRECIRKDERRLRKATFMCGLLRWPARLRLPLMRAWFDRWDEARSHARYELQESRACLWKAENSIGPHVIELPEQNVGYDDWLVPEDRFDN